MMGLIKAGDALARRARIPPRRVGVVPGAPALAVVVDAERLALEQQVEALSAEAQRLSQALQTRDALLAEREGDHRVAMDAAEAKGSEAGLAEGLEAKAEALLILEAGAAGAITQLRTDLRGLETLAVVLAKAALSKVFGDDRNMTDLVTRLVRRQLESLDRAAILQIEVSAATFPDAAALQDFSLAAGLEGIEAKAAEGLAAGDCRIRLRLGELEVGLGQQWGRLSGLLDDALTAEPLA